MKIILSYLLKVWAKTILHIIGWDTKLPPILEENQRYVLNKQPFKLKIVAIIQHSSKWDMIMFLLYLFVYIEGWPYFYPAIAKTIINKYPILKLCNHIPVTPQEEKKGNFVESTIKLMVDKDVYIILLSPTGNLRPGSEIRSGFYHLARGLGAQLRLMSFDYEKKKVVTSQPIPTTGTYHDCKQNIKKEISNIIPLYPETSPVSLRRYNEGDVSLVNWVYLTAWLSWLPLIAVLKNDMLLACILTIANIASVGYHYHYECDNCYRKVDILMSSLGGPFALLRNWHYGIYGNFFSWSFLILGFICYLKGTGRNKKPQRKLSYVKYHSLFHTFITLGMLTHYY